MSSLPEGTQCIPTTLPLDLTAVSRIGLNDSLTTKGVVQTYETDVSKWLLKTIQHKDIHTLWFNSQTFYLKKSRAATKFVFILHTQYTQ